MSLNIYKQLKNGAMLIVAILFSTSLLYAQPMAGSYTIDPAGVGATNFTTFKAAIDSLNAKGVGLGGVTFNVAAGATFAETGDLVLRATGTAANPIVFQKAGAGANPIINPVAGTIAASTTLGANGDVGFKIVGSDYLTINGIDMVEPAGRTGNGATEYGYALLKAADSNACRFVTIRNCNISLNRATRYSYGIYLGARSDAFASLTPLTAAGRAENIQILNNNISNVFNGIVQQANFTSDITLFDHFITIRNNNITNYSGNTSTAVSTAYAVYAIYVDSMIVSSNNMSNGTGHPSTLYGFFGSSGNGSSIDIDSNTVNLLFSGTTSSVFGINNFIGSAITGLNNSVRLRNNLINSYVSSTVTTGLFTGISNGGGAQTIVITGNTVRGVTMGTSTTSSTGTITGISNSGFSGNPGSTAEISGNTVRNITRTQVTAGSTGIFNAITVTSSALTLNVFNNRVANCSVSNTTSTSNIFNVSAGADLRNIYNNTVDSIFTGGGTMTGFNISGAVTTNFYGNMARGIYANKTNANTVTGLSITGGTTVNAYNNIITDLRAPITTSTSNAVTGINVSGGTTVNLSFNTVYLNASSSGANFNTAALNFTSGVTNFVSRNNILYNVSTPAGTGKAVAVRRGSVGTGNYRSTSNNNVFYAGTPSAARAIYFDGTNTDSSLAQFKTRVASGESLSLTGTLDFVNSTTTPFDLHINPSIATLVESAGVPVAGITTDFDGNTRNTGTPDIGADEGTFTPGADVQGPIISYTPLLNTGVLTNRTILVDITDRTGVNTTAGTEPRMYFRKRGAADTTFVANNSSSPGWKYVVPSNTTTPFSFTIDYALLSSAVIAGDTIEYFVVAQDNSGSPNVNTNSAVYKVAPTSVNLSATNFPVSGAINSWRLLPQVPATVTVGVGGTYPSLTGAGGLFQAINSSVMVSDVVASVISHLDEDGANALNQFTEEGPNAGANRLIIKPGSAVEDSIRGTFAGGLVRLVSADRVTFDGSFNGSGKYFVFINKNTTATVSAIQLTDNGTTNGCQNITIKNSIFSGLTTTAQSNSNYGISAGGSTGATGRNHNNLLIDSNDFNGLKFAIYAVGVTGGTEFLGLRISNNNIGSIDNRIRDKGIVVGGAIGARVTKNNIFGIRTISSTVSTSMAGIQVQGGFVNSMINFNTITDLAFTGTGGWDARGITVNSITNANDTIYGNMISYIRNDGWTSISDGTVGIAIDGGSNFHVYNNSVNLFGTHTNATFTSGPISAAIYIASTATNVRNNLVQNNMKSPNATAAPASRAYGMWFSGSVGTGGQVTALDNNNYAVDGSINSKVIIVNGTTAFNTLIDHQLANNRDRNSFAENPTFVDSLNLRINSGLVGTLLESHGQNIAGLSRDLDNQVRPGPVGSTNGGALTFDIGADEFDGVYLADIFPPTILIDSIRPPFDACLPVAHTVYARVTDVSGIDTVEIRYTVNGGPLVSQRVTSTGGGVYSLTIPAAAPGAVVVASIYAQDSLNNSTTKPVGTYVDAKFNFTTFSLQDTVATGSTIQLDANMPSDVKQVGNGTASLTTYPNPYYTFYWGNRAQYVITAAELNALGYSAGPITSLGLDVGLITNTLPLTNFTIKMKNTATLNITAFEAGLTQVYTVPVFNNVSNAFNNHVFQTPFMWDGVSNLLIETCFNNTNFVSGAQPVSSTVTAHTSSVYLFQDAAGVCVNGSVSASTTTRPNFKLGQPKNVSFVWSSSANGGLQSTNVRNPQAIPTGGAGLYSYYLTANDGTCSWTDTVSVRVVTAVTPVAGFTTDTIAAAASANPTIVSVRNSAINFPNTYKYTITPNFVKFENGTNANSIAPKFSFTRAGLYTIKQVVTNSAGSDSLTRTNYITVNLDYCKPARTSTFIYAFLSNVSLKGLSNTTGNTALPGYNNYVDSTNLAIPALTQGVTDTLRFTLAQGSSWPTTNATTAWIDYNQDGAFTADEFVGNVYNVASAGTVSTMVFKVPYTAVTGTTRMRVRTDAFGTAFTPLSPCSNTFYGEIEDYTVTIAAAPNMALQTVRAEQDTAAVLAGTPQAIVLRTKVRVTGFTNQLNVSSITVSTAGTTSLSDIDVARVYFTGNVDTFNTSTLFGSASPAASMVIPGNVTLLGDTNYFWVTYSVDSFAVLNNLLDAEITSITVGGTPTVPNVSAPAGAKSIRLQAVPTTLVGVQAYSTIKVYPNSKGNPAVAGVINMTNGVTSTVTNIKMSLTSSTKLANISRVRLMYSGADSTFTGPAVQFGATPSSIGGTLNFDGNVKLRAGANYFFLIADVVGSALRNDTLDGSFISATVQNIVYTPSIVSPLGQRLVDTFGVSCFSVPSATTGEDIGRLQIGSFVNQTTESLEIISNPGATENYNNYASIPGMQLQVEIPSTYQVNVVTNNTFTNTCVMNIFVDLNQNGRFDLPRERVVKSAVPFTVSPSTRTPSGTFKLPIGTRSGRSAMRVMVIATSTPGDTLDPCSGSYFTGEVEDYFVNVLQAPPGDYFAPIVTNITLSPDSQCVAVPHTITATVTDTTGIDTVSIRWTRNGAVQTPILMSNGGSGNVYTGVIPPQGRANIRFDIYAEDNSPRENDVLVKGDSYQDEYFFVSAGADKYVGVGQTASLSANTTLDRTFKITEFNFFNYTGGCGIANGSQCTWPSYLPTTMYDDNIEISNLSNAPANLSGYTIVTEGLATTFTFPAGTIVPAQSVAILHLTANGAVDVANNVFNIPVGGIFPGSGTSMGIILKDPTGVIVDAIATNSYVFGTTNGVTAADWSGAGIVSPAGQAGCTLQGNDLNNLTNWVVSSPTTPVSIGFLNPSLPVISSSATITWTGGTLTGPVTGGTITTPVHPTLGAYTYFASSSFAPCSYTDTIVVNAIAAPTVDLGPASATICGGQPQTLNAAIPFARSYVWYLDGVVIPGATSSGHSVTVSGLYKVIATNLAGQTATDSINYTLAPAFNYNFGPDVDVCIGGTRTLDAGAGYTSYLWSTGATTRTIPVTTAGTYTITVKNAGGCTSTDTFVVNTVNPTTVDLGADQDICASSPVTLDAGNPGGTYLWSTGATTQTIQVSAAGTYSVTVNTVTGCTLTDAMVVTNKPAPTQNLGADFQLCPGTTSVLDAGNAGSTYAWSTGATTQTITISTPGAYIVEVTNAAGCKTLDTLIVTPKAAPVVNLGANRDICTSDTITLDAGNAGATYLWSTGATTQTIRVSLAGTYGVAVTNAGGCTTSDDVVVTNKPAPNASFTFAIDTFITGVQVDFAAVQVAGNQYNWNFGDPTSGSNTSSLVAPTHIFSNSGTYTVTLTVTNVATGCISVQTTQITVVKVGFETDYNEIFKLAAAPNPFVGNTKIMYQLPVDAESVTIEVYDLVGRLINTIAKGEAQSSGLYAVDFNSTGDDNASGVYIVKLMVDGKVAVTRVIDAGKR
jgi:hypothetical protein